jgi:hypothetical protein
MRRSSTSTSSARSNMANSAADNGSDPGDPGVGAGSNNGTDPVNAQGTDAQGTDAQGTDAQGTDAQGTDAQGTDAQGTNAQGTDAQGTNAQGTNAPPPVKRRKRGPNKPKPGTFVVETKACMRQDEIVKLLIAHAVTQLGTDVANNMTLQVNVDGVCRPLGDVLQGGTLQFGTVVKD